MGGSIRLFRFAGIQVSLHFSWFLVAAYWISTSGRYSRPIWAVYEYVALFGIVLLHEFGHALACRSVGGRAEHIVLWPLGGVAFVHPPPRPGPILWSLAAGPLVNVFLLPIIYLLNVFVRQSPAFQDAPDAWIFFTYLGYINFGLLIFNMLPIYPLDGGQILRALLWFPLGPIRSLQIASVIGMAGATALGLYAFSKGEIWLGIIAFFVFTHAIQGWQQARAARAHPEVAQEVPGEPQAPPR